MYADSIAILESLADPRVLFYLSPLFLVFAISAAAVFYSLFRLMTVPPSRPSPSPQPQITLPAANLETAPTRIDPNPELEARALAAEARTAQIESQITVLTEKLSFATAQLSKEQDMRNALQTKAERLGNQFEEVVHEVEHIYHQNLGVAVFEDLTQRIGRIREGQPLEPRSENSPAPNVNPENLLMAEQSTEIRRLKDVVAFYKEKFGE